MNVYPRRAIFRRRQESNIYRMFLWATLILGGFWLIRLFRQGDIKPLFLATPTPTRSANSYSLEGEAKFTAGEFAGAIQAFQEAVSADPRDAKAWADLARIQTYSTALLTTDPERKSRLGEALTSINEAVAIAPDSSHVHAVRAFVLDWNASPGLLDARQVQAFLTEAEQEAVRALQLDNGNTMALAYYSEILVDQQKWTQADQNIKQALDQDDSLMDVHRVHAYVLESLGQYNLAIDAYDRAIAIAPNMTFLYLRAGANYRRLAFESPNEQVQRDLYEKSLEYFAKTAQINAQLGVEDPVPYLSISRTYSQMGEFFIAARNVQKALEFQPYNADIYGQLGVIYFKSRNYEGSIPSLKCAVRGCTAEESCDGRGGCGALDEPSVVVGLELSPNTVVYYYTYGSVLAALSRPQANYCGEALDVLQEVEAGFGEDPDIAGIVAAGQEICSSVVGENTPSINPVTTATLEAVLETPSPTPTP
jgi:tetratricopeptide (TPR) repeat protein